MRSRLKFTAALLPASLASLAILLSSLACAAGQESAPVHGDGFSLYPKLPHVTGHIDYVEARAGNPRYFRLLRITDASGTRWEFTSHGWAGAPVSHLKDHRIQGTTVTVWYEPQADGTLLARFVGD